MTPQREDDLLKIILRGYPDRVTIRRPQDPARGVMVGNRGVLLEPESVVRSAPLFVSLDARESTASGGVSESRVSMASAIREEWLEELFPHLLERRIVHRYDPGREKVASLRETVFAGLVVREDVVGPDADPDSASAALAEHLTGDPEVFFLSDPKTADWLARVRFLEKHMPELELPAFDTNTLQSILIEACAGCTTAQQVRRKGLLHLLESRLSWRQRREVDTHAPETIEVPSGSRIRLRYSPEGEPPVLAVRLQELFGLADTPRVAGGRVAVRLHLLGPNFRPVQITDDLKSFWNNTYAEVRKDLRARYPKHPWPEDPWTAPPKSVGGRRRKK